MVVCEICYEAPARIHCPTCGRMVCTRHAINGRCTVCTSSTCSICRVDLAITYCMVCGRLGCSNCLVQVDNVRRVCRECLPRVKAGKWPSPGAIRLYSMGARRLTYRILGRTNVIR